MSLLQHRCGLGRPANRLPVLAEGAPVRVWPTFARSPAQRFALAGPRRSYSQHGSAIPETAPTAVLNPAQESEQQHQQERFPEPSPTPPAQLGEEAGEDHIPPPSTVDMGSNSTGTEGLSPPPSFPSGSPEPEPSPSQSAHGPTSSAPYDSAASQPTDSIQHNPSHSGPDGQHYEPDGRSSHNQFGDRSSPQGDPDQQEPEEQQHQERQQQQQQQQHRQQQRTPRYQRHTSDRSSANGSSSWHPNQRSSAPASQPPSAPEPPPYASALAYLPRAPHQHRPFRERPSFLEAYPVPPNKTFNLNSFLGKRDIHGGRYLVPESGYFGFLEAYVGALHQGYLLFLTENYQQQVFRYFVELDWDWDSSLDLVMEVTPQVMEIITAVASEFYSYKYPNRITSIRTPYRIHLNFPNLITTELLAHLCRDRILDACRTQLAHYAVDWERLIDFPHGSLRLMGSRKAHHMDSDPAWVAEKAYCPAKLVDGKWVPARVNASLLLHASIFPRPQQVAAFERSPAYLNVIYGDMEAYREKIEERKRRREERLAQSASASSSSSSQSRSGSRSGSQAALPPQPPGSSKIPLIVNLEVNPDDTVSLKIYIKSRFRTKNQQTFHGGRRRGGWQPGSPQEGSAAAQAGAASEEGEGASSPQQQGVGDEGLGQQQGGLEQGLGEEEAAGREGSPEVQQHVASEGGGPVGEGPAEEERRAASEEGEVEEGQQAAQGQACDDQRSVQEQAAA